MLNVQESTQDVTSACKTTLFMVIILLPTMVFGGIIVDTARINMARSAISSAGDLAMNSQLADYDTVLKEVYGLFAMSQNKTQEEITEDVKRYFETTLSSYGVVSAEDSGSYVDKLLGDFSKTLFGEEETNASNFLNMNILDITATPEPKSALSNPDILKKQIVEYMKYRAPLEFGMSFFDSLRTFSSLESQSEVVNKMVSAQESTQDVTSACKTAMDSMREYDKIFDKFALTDPYDDSKKIIVWGKGSENDYDDMVLKYRDKWGSNYSKINLLNLVFIVKELSSDDVYMYDKSGSFIDIDNHSISKGYVSLSSDEYATGDKKAALDGYISEINGSGFTYNKIFDPVCVADGSITDVNKAASQYESFRTKASSSEVKNILKLLEKARDCWAESEGQLTTARKNRSDAEEKMEEAQKNISSDERLLIKNINTMIEYNDEYTTSEHSSVSNVAKQSLHFSTISEIGSNQKENNYKNWFKDKLGCTFDTYTENKFSSKKISRSGLTADEVSYLNLQSNNVGVLHDNINSISANEQSYTDNKKIFDDEDKKVKALEETKESYNAMLDNIHGHIDNYQADIKTQKDYVKAAQSTVDKMASTISKQFNEIRSNLDSLNTQLSTIKSNLETVHTRIKEYQKKVKEWESANDKRKDDSGDGDSFYKTNDSDIESTLKQYNLDSVETLQTLIDGKIKTVTNFIAAMDSANRFTYGGTKISDLKSWKEVKASAVDAGCDGFYTVSGANEKLKTLYKAPEDKYKTDGLYTESREKLMPNLNQAKQFVKTGIYGNSSFLAYLNKTFPESKEVSKEDEESKKAYDEMKDGSKTNSSKEVAKDDGGGEEKEDDGKPKTDKYGYTYKNVKFDPFLENLPSLHPYPDEEGGSADDTTGITPSKNNTVESDGDKINVSENTKNQTNIVSALFGNIGKALTAGRDNVYVMEYIFNNFSYNTRVQEAVVEGEKIDTISTAKSELESDKTLEKYKDKTKTLSNYPLNPDNNYLYGGEVEYILYGNQDSPSLNVTYAKASIYGVRFVLNGIFAFSNTEIRNETQTLGLAVQAATLGVVPYKAAQIVAQLALAAAESAIDLSQMESGMTVPVMKTDDTWVLSVKGAGKKIGQELKNYAGAKIEDAASGTVNMIIDGAKDKLKNSLTDLADASKEKIGDTVNELGKDLKSAVLAKGKEMLDTVFTQFKNEFTSKLNELQFEEFTKVSDAVDKVNSVFESLKGKVSTIGDDIDVSEDIKTALLGDAKSTITGWISEIQGDIVAPIQAITDPDNICTVITEQVDKADEKLRQSVTDYMADLYEKTAGKTVDKLSEKLTGVTDGIVDDLSATLADTVDDTAEKAKEKINAKINDTLNNKLGDKSTVGAGITDKKTDISTEGNKRSVASMIKFGYKDYLKVFMFIGLCVNDDGILSRTGDVIQMNICNAKDESNLIHNKGEEFRLSNAKTYVSVKANVQTDMLFLNMGLFQDQITNYGGVVESEEEGFGLSQMTTLQYTGLFGY